ncbi:MAG TPA: HEAT repeat domain-containing protein [Planctomycetota bacterium]|jgi:outer membrane murein-binding lipoprotein Lpp|nr:HEAT repeat domain-containing protein [Planctomycetota bacterium]
MKILKLLIPALVAVAAAGCVDLVEKEDLDEVTKKVDKLSAQVAQKNDMQALLYEELVKRTNGLEKKVGEMDIMVNTMKTQVARLEDLTRTLRAEVDALGKSPAGNPANPAQPNTEAAKAKLEDILLEVETVITQLRGGKLKPDDAAARLKPFAQHAAPRILTELRESLTRYDYAKQLEYVMGKLPPGELKVPLQGALKRAGLREAAARVVGATGDRELSKILEEYLAESDEDFKLNIGDALVRCRNGSGIPLLLQCLRSEQGATRTIAIAALKKLNRGEDLGYRSQASVEANSGAIKAWDEWSDKFAKTLFD